MRAAAAAGSSTRALAAAEGVRQRHWARGCAGQVARRADGARVAGDSAGNTALPVVPVRPQAAPYSAVAEFLCAGVWVVPDSRSTAVPVRVRGKILSLA